MRLALSLLALLASLSLRAQEVRINEVMASNQSGLRDENGDTSDWIELFNPGSAPVDLNGYWLSDKRSQPLKWKFGPGKIAPRGFLTVFASGKDRLPTTAVPVNPATVSGLRVWLDAGLVNTNDLSQVRRSTGQIFLRQWRDQSGNNSHAAQAADALQPLWIAAGLNGKPALRFDGANDLLTLPHPAGTNSFCIFAVLRTSLAHEIDPESSAGTGGVSGQRYLFGAQHGGDLNGGAGVSVGTNGVSVYEHGSGYMPALAVYKGSLASGPTVLAINYDSKRPTINLLSLEVRTGLVSPRSQVTAPVEIGSGAYGAFNGDLAEIIMFNRSLALDERRGVSQYLMAKHRLEPELPQHTNFQLDANGEEVLLTRPDKTLVDYATFGLMFQDVSYGRQPDGAGDFFLFPEPTPGKANTTTGTLEFLAPPVFSHQAGFYSNSFSLTIVSTTIGAEIRYTLDGSEPGETSPLYSAPLNIKSRTGTPNDLSNISTTPGGPVASGEVFKGWVVRARAFKPGASPSTAVTRSYWVDPKQRARYSLPVISLATARTNFFDRTVGIYVPGTAANGNYSQRGPAWQRPIHVEFIETNNAVAFSQEADVKIHGNTSQNFPIKGLDLDGTGGRGHAPFRYRIFPDRKRTEFEHILLRPSGHDQQYTFMRDELMQSLASETGAESQAARACIVFLNGEYWGLHYLKEKEDADFITTYGNVPKDGMDFLEGYITARVGETAHYDQMLSYLAANDIARPEIYQNLNGRMDVANYIDYKATEIFSYRWDIGNHRLWRTRGPEGKWRWLQFDNDVGWGGFWAVSPAWEFNMLSADLTTNGSLYGHNTEVTTFLLRKLMLNTEFKKAFINRFADLLNSIYLPAHTTERINQMVAVLQPEMTEHTRRWRAPTSVTEWQNNVQVLRNFANNRPKFMRQHLMQQFGLTGTIQASLSVSDTNRGAIQINSLRLSPSSEQPWMGTYFKGVPLTVTAIPKLGSRFAGWKGLSDPKAAALNLDPASDFMLKAEFAADRPKFQAMTMLPSSQLVATIEGLAGQVCQLESSRDLAAWTALETVTLDAKGINSIELDDSADRMFYRIVVTPTP